MKPSDFVEAAKDHYWDSLEGDRDLIIKHIEGIAQFFEDEANCSCAPGQGGPCSYCMEMKYNL